MTKIEQRVIGIESSSMERLHKEIKKQGELFGDEGFRMQSISHAYQTQFIVTCIIVFEKEL